MRPASRHSLRRSVAALVLLAATAPASAVALPSDLDPTYGNGGTTSIDARPGTRADRLTPYRAVERPDGGVIVAGQSDAQEVFVAKYTAAGALDPAFGSGGLVFLDFGPASVDEPSGLAIDSQNRVVVAGRADDEAFIARYTPAGQLDTTFAGDGVLVHPTPGDTVSFSDLALDTDDGIYVATSSAPTTIRRYTAAGTLDFGFGIAGVSTPDQFGSIRLDLDPVTRRLVIGGDQSGNSYRFARLQGKADPFAGNYDATFSGDGQLDITSPQAPGTFKDLDVAANGTIAVVGTTSTEGHTVIRLTEAGVPAGLDGDGVITNAATPAPNDEPIAIDASVNGAFVVAGASGSAGGYVQTVVVADGSHGAPIIVGCETGSTCTPADMATRSGETFYLTGSQATGAQGYVAARVGSSGAAKVAFGGDGFAELERRVPWGLTTITSSLDDSGNLTTFGQAGLYNDESSFLLRQGPTGAAAADFGVAGAAIGDLQPSAGENTSAAARAGDGSWLLAPSDGSGNLVLRRMTGGGLDGAFGTGGSVTVPIATTPGHEFQPLALLVDGQGRVVVAGEQRGPGGSAPRSAVIVRVLPQSGIIDPNFNGGAPVLYDVVGGGDGEQLGSLAILPGGGIVAGGSADSTAIVVRLTGAGSPAPGFGTSGYAALPALGTREAGAPVRVATTQDGTVLVGTSIVKGGTDREIAVGRLTPSGALDPAYGTAGVATVAPSDSAAQQLADMVPDHLGRAVIVGQRALTGTSAGFVARLTLDGQPDSEFAAGGRVVLDLAGGGSSRLLNVHLRSRRILAVGDAVDNATKTGRVVTVQLIGDPEPAPSPTPTASPTPTPAPTVTPAIRSTITPLRRPRARKALTLKGTTTASGGTTTRVQISIRQIRRGKCLYLRSAKTRSLRSIKPVRGACTKPVFLTAKGTTSWSLALRKGLPAGTYEITSRATLSTGLVEGSFVAGRNVLRVKLK